MSRHSRFEPTPGPYRHRKVGGSLRPLLGSMRRTLQRGPRLTDYQPKSMIVAPEHSVSAALVAAVDVHCHLGRWLTVDGDWMEPNVGQLLNEMDACNLSLLVNLDGRWGTELEENLDRYDRAHPGRFMTFCHVDWTLLEGRGGVDALVRSLEQSAAQGARGLKVWKDLGLHVRVDGRRILPSDPLLAPVWEAAGALHLPVLIHVGDPLAFFEPVDRHNERLEALLRFRGASWAHYGPATFAALVEALETLVASHERTTFIGAHLAHAENLAWVTAMLDRYPNFYVDTAAFSELGRRPRAASTLFERHPERILFGADVFPIHRQIYAHCFRLLETDDEYFPYAPDGGYLAGRWHVSGLALPGEILERVYRTNALRLLDVEHAPG